MKSWGFGIKMKYNKKIEEKILDKIDKVVKTKKVMCPLCKKGSFTMAKGFVSMIILDKFPEGISIGGPHLPNIAIVCTTCGNTMFLNLKVLGFNLK